MAAAARVTLKDALARIMALEEAATTTQRAAVDLLEQDRAEIDALMAENAALKAQLAQGGARPTLTMAQTREQHVAPCGRGFTSDAKVAEHVAYWAGTDRACTAEQTGRGHGARG